MIKRKEAMSMDHKENFKGGTGSLSFVHLFTKEELPKTRLCSVLTVEPGASVGQHSHTGEGELYVVLDGPVTLQEDGVDHILHTGDAEYCSDGHPPGAPTHTDNPAVPMAIDLLCPGGRKTPGFLMESGRYFRLFRFFPFPPFPQVPEKGL